MKNWQLAGCTALLALGLGIGSASAQVTPEEVWQNWQDMTTSYGQSITTTSSTRDGDTLRVEGAVISMDNGTDGKFDAQLGTLNFRDLGNGTVELTMVDSFPVNITTPAADDTEKPTKVSLIVSQPGMKFIAGGSPSETTYDYNAPTVNVKLSKIEGVDAAAVDLTGDISMTAVTGNYRIAGDAAARVIDSAFAVAAMAMVFQGKDPDSGSDVDITASIADIAGSTKGTFLGAAIMENMAEALKAGFNAEGGFSYGKTSLDANVTDPTGPTRVSTTAESGSLTFAVDKSRLAYGVGGKGMAVTVSSPDIPFPEVKITYAEALINLLMPVSKSDVPEDFAFTTKIVDFAISDEVWAMFDPTGGLPHDPATIIIDTKGKAKLTVDLTDDAATAALGDTPPGELHSLELTELKAKVAGAELTGSGAATFDNSDLTTFEGMPVPTGKVDMKLVGANTLLDKLIAMGLLPEEEAMGFRMMAGIFTVVGEGEDTLTSTIEFKDKGIFANGQRLK